MMLISTAGAPGLWQQRAVNCCLWASETFPASGGPSRHPLRLGTGSSQREGEDVAVIPATGEPEKVPACLMACLPRCGQQASLGEKTSAWCRGDPFLPTP